MDVLFAFLFGVSKGRGLRGGCAKSGWKPRSADDGKRNHAMDVVSGFLLGKNIFLREEFEEGGWTVHQLFGIG